MPPLPLTDYHEVVLVVLGANYAGLDSEALIEKVADIAGPPAEERVHPAVGRARYVREIKNARALLATRGLVMKRPDGLWMITPTGLELLDEMEKRYDLPPEGVPEKSNEETTPPARPGRVRLAAIPETPAERAERALYEHQAEVEAELAGLLLRCSAPFFERIALRLLAAMGYGAFLHTGRSGDDGIDGLLRSDPLGLGVVYVQAKRVQPDKPVDPGEVRDFAGALAVLGGAKGVFVTNGYFAKPIGDDKLRPRMQGQVRVIDGKELTALMVEHGIGVSRAEVRVIPEVNRDFFFDED
jgi:restriction system protein